MKSTYAPLHFLEMHVTYKIANKQTRTCLHIIPLDTHISVFRVMLASLP